MMRSCGSVWSREDVTHREAFVFCNLKDVENRRWEINVSRFVFRACELESS